MNGLHNDAIKKKDDDKDHDAPQEAGSKSIIDKTQYKVKMLLALKIFIYFLSIVFLQNHVIPIMLLERQKQEIIVDDQLETVILFEVLIFFFSIFSQMLFLLMSRFASFRTIKERLELGGNIRYRRDFLEHVKDDVHYLMIAFVEIFLYIYVSTHRHHEISTRDKIDMALIGCHKSLEFFLIYMVYFKKHTERSKVTPIFKLYIALTFMLVLFLLSHMAVDRTIWWPYIIQYGLVQFCVIMNVIFEVYRFSKHVKAWKREFFVMRALNELEQ